VQEHKDEKGELKDNQQHTYDLGACWEKNKNELWSRCLNWTRGDRYIAEEIIANTALKMVNNQNLLPLLDNPLAWLLRVAWRQFIDNYRAQRSFANFSQLYSCDQLSIKQTYSYSPEETLLIEETVAQVSIEINNLPEQQRLAFEMRVLHEVSYKNVASILSISSNNARKRVQLARDKLNKKMKAYN